MNLPTWLLGPLLAVVLVLAMVAVGRLVAGWLRARQSDAVLDADKDRIALEDRKEQVLTTLRDLEFEHATGKLSDNDYDDLKRFFEREALDVMAQLETMAR